MKKYTENLEILQENARFTAIDALLKAEVANLSETLAGDGNFTTAEKELVAEVLIQSVAPGETLTKEEIQDAGIAYQDLPADTPVEVREDENGNEIVIIAEVAAALELIADPGALVSAIFDDPAQALLAVASLGADMSEEEREESEKVIVTSVIVTGIALQSAMTVAGGTASSSSRSSSGGGSGGGGGGGGASSDSKGKKIGRRRTTNRASKK